MWSLKQLPKSTPELPNELFVAISLSITERPERQQYALAFAYKDAFFNYTIRGQLKSV